MKVTQYFYEANSLVSLVYWLVACWVGLLGVVWDSPALLDKSQHSWEHKHVSEMCTYVPVCTRQCIHKLHFQTKQKHNQTSHSDPPTELQLWVKMWHHMSQSMLLLCSLLCRDRHDTRHCPYLGKLQPFIIYPYQSLHGKISLKIFNLADLSEALKHCRAWVLLCL